MAISRDYLREGVLFDGNAAAFIKIELTDGIMIRRTGEEAFMIAGVMSKRAYCVTGSNGHVDGRAVQTGGI